MRDYALGHRTVTQNELFALAHEHCQSIFAFTDAVKCTAQILWNVLIWAASRTKSLHHARERLHPDLQDQTLWNRLRANLSKQKSALERRLNSLLRLPKILPKLASRKFLIAIDYHLIPYYGSPKKVRENCVDANPNEARPSFMPTQRPALS